MSIFGGVVNTSEIYKTSAWENYTPVILPSGGLGTITMGTNKGRYIQAGRVVFVSLDLRITTVASIPAGDTICVSLPFPPDNFTSWPGITGYYIATSNTNLSINCSWTLISPPGNVFLTVRKYDGSTVAVNNSQTALSGWYVRSQ